MGRGVGASGARADHQHSGADDIVPRHRGTEVLNASVRKAGVLREYRYQSDHSREPRNGCSASHADDCFEAEFLLRPETDPLRHQYGNCGQEGYGPNRALGVREIHTAAHPEPHARNGQYILAQDVTALRRRVGMVFQRPNPFPKSIFDNVAYGLRINGYKGSLADTVEKSLRHAALWDEVKDHLHKSAYELSGGQQQRLCIARALAVEPEVLLMDEPCSALDPISTAKIEELLVQLKDLCTIVTVTHNMQQAARISDFTAFLLNGQIIEFSPTPQLFTKPTDARTEAYITGRFG